MKNFFFALILGLMSSVPTWARETTFDFTGSNLQWAPVAGDSKSFKTSQNGFTAIVKLNETSSLEKRLMETAIRSFTQGAVRAA